MKKFLSVLILLSLLLCLCACGKAEPATADEKAVWHGAISRTYPLGVNGIINGLAALENRVFVGGEVNGEAKLLMFNITLGNNGAELSGKSEVELPNETDGAALAALSQSGERVYALLCPSSKSDTPSPYCTVAIYNSNGELEGMVSLSYAESAPPKGLLALDDGKLCLWWLNRVCIFSADGSPLCDIEADNYDFVTPMSVNGEVVVQLYSGIDTVELSRIAVEKSALEPIEGEQPFILSTSVCQSADGKTYLNDGGNFSFMDSKYRVTQLFNWFELTAQYSDYSYICSLDEYNFLMTRKNSGMLLSMHRFSTAPTRTVRVAFAGYSKYQMDMYELLFRHYATDYNVECVRFGVEPGDELRLAAELGAKDGIDLLICDLPMADPSNGFVDLYPLLDADEELSRDDFPSWILEGLEQDGHLNEIWGSFIISTWAVYDILFKQPEPLTLWGCKDFLESQGYDGLFFSSTETKERMLSNVASCIFSAAHDENSGEYRLDTPYIRDLLEFCNTFPAEDPYKILDGNIDNVDPSLWFSYITIYVMIGGTLSINSQKYGVDLEKVRFFDGQNGGDNLSNLSAGPVACYLIPKTCPDVENAWGFLRSLLKSDFQTALFDVSNMGIPVNINAYDFVVDTLSTPEIKDQLNYMISHSPVHTYDSLQLNNILVSSIQPWFNGDATLENALSNAQGRVNIFTAERAD